MEKTAPVAALSDDSFLSILEQYQNSDKFWIAFSGGMDSSVLLHLFYTNKKKIKHDMEVVYVDHGLQAEAADWAKFCQEQCKQYDIPFTQLEINESCPKGESVEAWAREKRYKLIENLMEENDVLFTGHHQDDQVETFFLQAFRGAGPRGLASMPSIKKKNNTFLARPLLNFSRKELARYAEEHKLSWQDDKSNVDERYDRNYFRHKLAPVIEERWPAYRETFSRLISHQKETKVLLDELAEEDIKAAKITESSGLDVRVIKTLSHARQKNLLFVWLEQLGLQAPGSRNIEKVISDIVYSEIEKSPCVNWGDVEIRRFKNIIYAQTVMSEVDNNLEYQFQPENSLSLFEEMLVAKEEQGKGISKSRIKGNELIVRFRKGGEKIKPNSSTQNKTIKKLFQERSVLPWYRDRIPLIYVNDELAAIPGFCVANKFMAEKDEASWDIQWSGFSKAIQT